MNKPTRRSFALCGHVEGSPRTYLLGSGLNFIGSRSDCSVVLAFRGVSKRHALILVEPHGILLEDLNSKNGTFVDNKRIESRVVRPGDRLRFAGTALTLEEFDTTAGGLAIRLSASAPVTVEDSTAVTSDLPRLGDEALPFHWLRFLSTLVQRLQSGGGYDPGVGLRWILEELSLDGACLIEWVADEPPWLHAAAGEVRNIPHRGHGLDVDWRSDQLFTIEIDGLPGVGTVLRRPERSDLGLVLWNFEASGEGLELLLRLLIRLFSLVQAASSNPAKALGPSDTVPKRELVLPAGHLRCPSSSMQRLYRQIAALAGSTIPMCILGETGVGKEGVAAMVHASSDRHSAPFVTINCAALPSELLEAELFGIGAGVATGVRKRPGKFQLADGGTLFLDEIGEMPLTLQAKLLRALQEKEIHPLGGESVRVDVRILAATNVDLDARLDQGLFRHDLYFRLAGSVLQVPPLRQRREDIPPLVERFLKKFVAESGREVRGLTLSAMQILCQHSWPGNVRQLEHVIQRLVYLCRASQIIGAEMLDSLKAALPIESSLNTEIPNGKQPLGPSSTRVSGEAKDEKPSTEKNLPCLELGQLERLAVEQALARTGGNQSQAARLLGITRTSLYRRLIRYGL